MSQPCLSSCKLHGSHLQPTVLRWQEWVELPKHEIGLKWWSEDLFFFKIKPHLRTPTAVYSPLKSDRYHCFSSPYFLVWKPKPTYTITCEFFTWPNLIRRFAVSSWNGEDKIPPDCEIQSTMTYPVPFWRGSPSRCKSESLSSSSSWAEQYFWQWCTPPSNHPSMATSWSHFNIPWNG